MTDWTIRDVELLKRLWPEGVSPDDINAHLSRPRTPRSMRSMAYRSGVSRPAFMSLALKTAHEHALLAVPELWYQDVTMPELCQRVGCGQRMLRRVAAELGLPRVRSWVTRHDYDVAPVVTWWTVERVDRLRQLWAAGVSADLIAEELGCPSRSSVLGKVFRLGLDHRVTQKRRARPAAVRRPRAVRPVFPIAAKVRHWAHDVVAEFAAPAPVGDALEPDRGGCAYPVGEDWRQPGFYCGRRRDVGSYCAYHDRVAHKS